MGPVAEMSGFVGGVQVEGPSKVPLGLRPRLRLIGGFTSTGAGTKIL